jgi:DNA replication and repair protein RecF
MILDHLRVTDLRNHAATEIACPQGALLLLGENGAGKTTVLEAISLLCSSRSFVTRQDRGLIATGASGYRVEGEFTTLSQSKRHVRVQFSVDQQRKRIDVDHAPLESAADLIGLAPMVALSPQHRPITTGGPAERRSFIDFVISQAHRSYLDDLIAYRKTLRQRNALLAEAEGRVSAIAGIIDAWDQSLADIGVRILKKRATFIAEFLPYVHQAMRQVIDEDEMLTLRYESTVECDVRSADAVQQFIDELQRKRAGDLRRGSTAIGPHRDDLSIAMNGLDVRAQASQGQHKTILFALKLAEYRYIDEHLDERPILLLDDVFSELDDERLSRVLAVTEHLGQTFITSANNTLFRTLEAMRTRVEVLRIEHGRVYSLADVA